MRPKAVASIWANGLAKTLNSDPLPFTTVVLKLNQGTLPKTNQKESFPMFLLLLEKVAESRMRSFSGRLFSFFFGGAKKNKDSLMQNTY